MELKELLQKAYDLDGSDIFIVPGAKITCKVKGDMVPLSGDVALPDDTEALVREAYRLANRDLERLREEGDDDFSFAIAGLSRFRCNAYYQRGTIAATCRMVAFGLPDPKQLGIPDMIMDLTRFRNGMILVTGPAGSGKSTTLACMVDKINQERHGHIVTIEDPIEYIHRHKNSLISQRDVPNDAPTFARALRASLRQAPDVIMLGEMRDLETIRTAITAAETGHLVLSSLHTTGAAKTVDRILDTFPAEQQAQVRVQISMVLRAVVSQRLVPKKNGGQVGVFEVMTVNPAVQNLIRDGRTHQIDNAIFGGAGQGMISMDAELQRLCRAGEITKETALLYAVSPETLAKRL
ncbi:MAG: PilT/PilU family type 4a pilus ATPase [Clostridia bacterium]|nr:PilT/PilU family type 4a pilus ATPase [Clostridia bacterium]MBQ8972487.1 PilT/PilU family type 4a pilus ATPase [Clostridia bacterium]